MAARPPEFQGHISPSGWFRGTGVAKFSASQLYSFPGFSPGDPGIGHRRAYPHRTPFASILMPIGANCQFASRVINLHQSIDQANQQLLYEARQEGELMFKQTLSLIIF